MHKASKDTGVNPITTWKRVKLVRDQAFLPVIASIAEFSRTHNLVKIGIIGYSASGKSTLAQAITHALHVYYMKKHGKKFSAKCFYYPRVGDGYDLSILEPGSCIITMDDFNCIEESFKNKMMQFESAIRKMQHADSSMKVVFICTYFDEEMDKYHRQEDFRFFIDRDNGELEQALESRGIGPEESISFTETHLTAIRTGKWRATLEDGTEFYYKYKKPFVPCLFWNGQEPKRIVTPRRQFMEKKCDICKRWEEMWWWRKC